MKPGLSLRVSQHLSLTPQLQQSIQLLQLSTLELAQEVEQMLVDNPFLELDGDEPGATADATETIAAGARESSVSDDYASEKEAEKAQAASESIAEPSTSETPDSLNWEADGLDGQDGEWGGEASSEWDASSSGAGSSTRSRDGDDEADAIDLAREHESLTDFLHRQALSLHLGAEDMAALRFLIESLSDDGYLEESLQELAQSLAGDDLEEREELEQRFAIALKLLQSLEPVGVGARDLAECLQLQLRDLIHTAEDEGTTEARMNQLLLARSICAQPMDLLARRDLRKLASLCGAREEQLREAMALIARLEPRPGRRFVDLERHIVVPDVIVRPVRSSLGRVDFAVQLNPDVMPKLRVHDVYANVLRRHKSSEGHAALQQRLQEARWFIKNIQQRFDTIQRVSEAIVERQKNFFVHGELAMRPLVLRDIADALGLHESTISRVTTAKYMATPQGTFELKYFFGSGLGTETGGSASSTAVRALIKQFVDAEDAKKPLSDAKLADMLKEQGIECARRTVAKYREQLKIPTTTLRKAL
ncbi:MAG: RNA polymerase factor sigma-54 [Comamonas sp.]|jgi:RNA polymerase sigma-54 factor|uniref:RNA polymerase factor sigma-54 n=1 Tax=Comamonas sp. TaxID=34028 RepID=UPI0028275B7D|nr:RNA polymerase factor sigma-54 [Comamonas sp.]MDR0214637.1 RNA polymerase factor sigma-54 [Comamonas sp.]